MATHSSILAWKKSHVQRSLAGYSPWVHKRVGHNLETATAKFLAQSQFCCIVTADLRSSWANMPKPAQHLWLQFCFLTMHREPGSKVKQNHLFASKNPFKHLKHVKTHLFFLYSVFKPLSQTHVPSSELSTSC